MTVTATLRAHRRKLRFIVPIGIAVTLIAVTLIAHAVQQPDPADAAFLSPTSRAGIGAADLADRLTRAGVTIERKTDTPAAILAASTGDATLLIPEPGLVWSGYLEQLPGLPPTSRVVLVAPGRAEVSTSGLDVVAVSRRWTAAAPEPGCTERWASGPAAVERVRYVARSGGRFACYGGGIVEAARLGAPITYVGAADPFRNDRLDEHRNAAVVTGLLSRTRRVVWLDLHSREKPPPGPNHNPDAPKVPPTQGPVDGPDDPDDPQAQPPDSPTIFDAFPPAVWATLGLLLAAALALAGASARRVGAPVAEPLPVRVRAAETVRGLGGLYRRARADDTSLATIQAAARRRLADHFGLPPDSTAADLAPYVRVLPPDQVERLLGDPAQDLATTAEAVQNLVRHVKGNVT